MRAGLSILFTIPLAGCLSVIPESGAEYRSTLPSAPRVQSVPLETVPAATTPASSTETGVRRVITSQGLSNDAIATVASSALSSENDFAAVSAARTIDQDAARVAANRDAYIIDQPQAVPGRPQETRADVVQYALVTSNGVGQKLYNRFGASQSRAARNCAKYPSPDIAQAYFLDFGGPEKNVQGLDPDGDGFACSWNPEPFRLAAGQ